MLGVSILTLFLGLITAWLTVFYDFYFKKLFSYLLIIPIAIPPYAVAYCYADIADKGGVLFSFLEFLNLEQLQYLLPSVRSISQLAGNDVTLETYLVLVLFAEFPVSGLANWTLYSPAAYFAY